MKVHKLLIGMCQFKKELLERKIGENEYKIGSSLTTKNLWIVSVCIIKFFKYLSLL